MFTDARITAAFEKMVGEIDAPPFPMVEIWQRVAQPQASPRRATRFYYFAAATAVALTLALVLPSVAPGFSQTVEEQIEAILRWKPPPPAPKSVWSAMRPQAAALAQAQSRVAFRIVPPAGLPADVLSEDIQTAPSGVYSTQTHSWGVGNTNVTFGYRRADGRIFRLMAGRFGADDLPPSRYIFEDMDRKRGGHEWIVRRDVFTWRNGDQAMSAVAGDGITAAEIAAIRTAMHGIIIPGLWPGPPEGTTIRQIRIPGPP
jgi:hypothetical protein